MTRREAAAVLDPPAPAGFLVELDADHPGFRDPTYRARRDAVARHALEHEPGTPATLLRYTGRELSVWRQVLTALGPLHERFVATPLRKLLAELNLPRRRVPQLAELSARTEAATGFRLVPVAGLAQPLAFLEALGRGEFHCTQYLRHHARPLYTPEPDLLHETVGHVATLLDGRLANLQRRIGKRVASAEPEEQQRLSRVFWHAVEFGAVLEDGRVKAVGAGLLSSCSELSSFCEKAELLDWDLELMAETDYDPTDHQPRIFVADSWNAWLESLEALAD